MSTAAPPAIVVAAKSQLLKLTRVDGETRWIFADAAPKKPKPQKPPPDAKPKMDFEHDAAYGECVGTLRWSEKDAFPKLAAWPLPAGTPPPALSGWRKYLEMRLANTADASGTLRIEPPMIDGLSYPLSLVFALQQLRLRPPQPGPLQLLLVGASSKAEERLMRETTYWHELLHYFPGANLELVFVGPEINTRDHGKKTQHGPRLVARCFHGTLGDLLRAEPNRHSPEQSIVVGFNPGFGNCSDGMAKGGFALMSSWLPDLCDILRLGLVAVFTCANDYSDLRGELALWQTLLHADLVLQAQRNPFKAATVVRESNELEVCEWSCSSSYVYAVCGREDGAPPLPSVGDKAAEEALKKEMRKMAKKLAKSQAPSQVP